MENKNLDADIEKIQKMPLAEKKKYAKELYNQYTNLTDISKSLDIKLPTLKSWVYGLNNKKSAGWKVERELAKNQLLKDLSADKRGMVYNMVNGSLYLIYDFVEKSKEEVIKSGKKIDIKTADKLASILGQLHKIIIDEQNNQDDDADFVKPTNAEELQKRFKSADPFAEKDEDDEIVISEEDLK